MRQSSAQNIPIGTWREHFSFESVQLVASDGDRTFAASRLALFLYENGETSALTKVDGLSGGAITGLAYEAAVDVLLIGYENGSIDLIQNGALTSLNELADGDFGIQKAVNGFVIDGDRAYAATELGIATINLATQQITEIFREIGPRGEILTIREIFFEDGIFYAVTEDGILTGNQSSNLLDFNNWSLFRNTVGFNNLSSFNGEIITSRSTEIFQLNPSTQEWESFLEVPFDITDLQANGNQIYILGAEELLTWEDSQFSTIEIDALTERTITRHQSAANLHIRSGKRANSKR